MHKPVSVARPTESAMAVRPLQPRVPLLAPVPSSAVLQGQRSVDIEHQGVIYRLQVTKLGKLILTK